MHRPLEVTVDHPEEVMAAGMAGAAGVHLTEEEDIVHLVDLLLLRRKGHLQELIHSKLRFKYTICAFLTFYCRLWQWFSSADSDRSGQISAEELQQCLINGDWTRESNRLLEFSTSFDAHCYS